MCGISRTTRGRLKGWMGGHANGKVVTKVTELICQE